MKTNPYIYLRQHGVRGTVPASFSHYLIYDRAGQSVTIFCGALDNEAWEYGYDLNLADGSHISRIPGCGKGWFRSRNDALLYAAAAIRVAFASRLDPLADKNLESFISSVANPSLFEYDKP